MDKGMCVGSILASVIGFAGASILELRLLFAIFEEKLMAAFRITIFSIAIGVEYLANLLAIMKAVKRRIKNMTGCRTQSMALSPKGQ
jgi:hypothetical protein